VARIAWGGESDLTADDLLDPKANRTRQNVGEQAAEVIEGLMDGKPMPAKELEALLLARGFSTFAIRAGRQLAGLKAGREGFGKGSQAMLFPAGDDPPK
jgi:hypothetical protein